MSKQKVYYKVLDYDMKSPQQNFQYEMNKNYTTEDDIEPCDNGYHACKNMYELVIWCSDNNIKDCRFFECVLGDTIIEDRHKVVSNSITLTKEISYEIVDKDIRDNIDTLVHDEDITVRATVAMQGYGLDILIHDKSWQVRLAVARQSYGLDTLINDNSWYVRRAVARQGYGLDILIHDEDWGVRAAVAEQGYGLDILIHDEDWGVREIAALEMRRNKNRKNIE